MGEWREYKFSDFVLVNPKVTLKSKSFYPFVEMKDLSEGKKICESTQERILKGGSRFKNFDTLFARITPCLENGKICQVRNLRGEKGFGSTEFHVLRGKEKVSDPDFVFYLSRWTEVRNHAEVNLHGTSGRQRMPKEAFNELILNLPPLFEQKAIAEILSSLDDKIDLLHRQNKTLEQMAETLFRQWFVEEAGEDWWRSIDEVEIEIIDGDRGKNYPKKEELLEEGYCLFLSAKNVTLNGFDISQKQFISKEKDALLRKGKLQRGDIILTTRGTVGNFFFYDKTIPFENIRINSGMIILRSYKYDPILFYNIFKSSFFKQILFEFTSGSAQPQIPIRDFKKINIPFPAIDIIQEYLTIITPIYQKKFENNNQIRTLEKLRDTLLPKLMSGEVRVKI